MSYKEEAEKCLKLYYQRLRPLSKDSRITDLERRLVEAERYRKAFDGMADHTSWEFFKVIDPKGWWVWDEGTIRGTGSTPLEAVENAMQERT